MLQRIIRNNIYDTADDNTVFQFLKDFKDNFVKCLYCFQSDPQFLCLCKDCGYYFCNHIHRKTSHIVIHLRQCKHSKISLNPFDRELACEKCRKKDAFSLNFKEKQILCDDCVEDIQEEDEYKRVIEEKKMNNEILMSPNVAPVANRFDSYSESLIARINNKILKLKELGLETVSITYQNKKKYCTRYINLLENEISHIEKENEEEDFFDYELKFNQSGDYITADIKREDQGFIFYHTQLLIVAKANNKHKFELARVINVDQKKNIITIYFSELNKVMKDGIYSIKEKESNESTIRMIEGLKELKKDNSDLFDKNILDLIIGIEPDEDKTKGKKDQFNNENEYLDKNNLPRRLYIQKFDNKQLNKNQEDAIKNCFKNKLTLIRGPPGTGKTKVLSALAFHLIKLRKTSSDKIFIGAPSNRAVDNISYYLQKLELPFVRVLSAEKESSENIDKTNSLDDLVNEEIEKDSGTSLKKYKELRQKKLMYGKLSKDDYENYLNIIQKYQERILDKYPLIIATINNSAEGRIKGYNFPIVIIDEATQALEPDCLLPLYHNAKMVVLLGDEKQLGPTVKSLESEISGLSISLFERLCFYYKGSDFISTLTQQYRMHSTLYEFSNKHFYDNKMETVGEIELNEDVKNKFPWPNKEIPTFFHHNIEPEKKENYSYYNENEIFTIFGIIYKLEKIGVPMKDIGIITPYNAQKLKLQFDKFNQKKYDDLQIESVDGFQGMEKEYIVISTVRSNLSGGIGFVSSPKRLNVSLTRAKRGVIIVGNAECLSKRNGIWRDLIAFYKSKNLIFKGPLSNLEPVSDDDLHFDEIPEDEELKEDNDDETKPDKYLTLDKKTSSELIWGMPAPPVNNDSEEEEEDNIEEKTDKNEIIGLEPKKQKKNKGKKKQDDEEDENEVEEKVEDKKQNKKSKKEEKNEKTPKNKNKEEKEEKKNKKKDKEKKQDKDDSDSEENNKGKKKQKKTGKK